MRTIRYLPKRNDRTRRNSIKILFIVNLWLIYLIFLSINYISTNNTYSYFSDEDKIENTFSVAEDFCKDKNYEKNHKDICKDNAGIGNGSELVDQNQYSTGDEDNPGRQDQYCPDDPSTPEIEVCNDQNNGNGNTKNSSDPPSSSNGSSP